MPEMREEGARPSKEDLLDGAKQMMERLTPQPSTQEKKGYRENWPAWAKQFPKWTFNKPNEDYQLIDRKALKEMFSKGKCIEM